MSYWQEDDGPGPMSKLYDAVSKDDAAKKAFASSPIGVHLPTILLVLDECSIRGYEVAIPHTLMSLYPGLLGRVIKIYGKEHTIVSLKDISDRLLPILKGLR